MLLPKKYRNLTPLFCDDHQLIYAKGNKVFKSNYELQNPTLLGQYKNGLAKNFLAKTNFGSRIGRLGFHGLQPFQKGYIGIQRGNIVYKPKGNNLFKNVFSDFRGSRPLNIYVSPNQDWACFGEYFGNKERESVNTFSSTNGKDWQVAYTFPSKSIRHVHGIIQDDYRNGIWILTGDSNDESALWFTSDRFKTLDKVISGSQKARAVEIIPTKEGLIVPMDSPMEKNYIHFFDIKNKTFTVLHELAGSAFHAIKSNDIYFVTTVTEPSEINKTETTNVYASLDGKQWRCISKLKKDFVPIKYQGITRYSEIVIPPGVNSSKYIIGYARAVQGGNFMLKWMKEEVLNFLKKEQATNE